jgi:hypothetical protein
MAMTLQQAIDYAIAPTDPTPFGLETYSVISLHDDEGAGTLMSGVAGFPNFTFRQDLPLLNWGPATISRGGLVGGGWFAPTQVPGFSTRGQGGTTLTPGTGGGAPIPIDLSVRRNPGRLNWSFLGLGPSVQIEIDILTAAGTATGGVTLNAVEDGALVRAVGPSVRDPARTASYTFTMVVWARIG